MPRTPPPAEYLELFARRILTDAFNEASSEYWRKRAAQFDAVGNARCDETAQACRNHAALIDRYGLPGEENEVA